MISVCRLSVRPKLTIARPLAPPTFRSDQGEQNQTASRLWAGLLMRGLNSVGPSKRHHQAVQAPGETVDIEIQRIVVAIGDLGIDRGMEGGNKPSFGACAGDDINEREPIVLGDGEGGIGRSCVVAAAMPGHAPPRLKEFVVHEQALQCTTEFGCLLEFRLAPCNRVVMAHQQLAGAANENMRSAPSVRAVEVSQIIEFRTFVDVVRKRAVAEVRSAGVMDHEISRHRRVGIVVMSAR